MKSFSEGILEIMQSTPTMSSEELGQTVAKLLQLVVILHKQRNGLCEYKTQIDDFDEEVDTKIFQDN